MRRFQDLSINLPSTDLEKFTNELSKVLPQEWVRNTEREEEIKSHTKHKMFCFMRNKTDGLDSNLWLAEKNSYSLYVSNIVPTEKSQLKIHEYNKVLNEFMSIELARALESLGATYELTTEEYSLDDITSKEVARALRVFSSSANKSTGSSHPCDKERWFEFVVLAYKSDKKLAVDEVGKFLVDDGWSDSIASDLSCEYEYSLSLLEYYEGK